MQCDFKLFFSCKKQMLNHMILFKIVNLKWNSVTIFSERVFTRLWLVLAMSMESLLLNWMHAACLSCWRPLRNLHDKKLEKRGKTTKTYNSTSLLSDDFLVKHVMTLSIWIIWFKKKKRKKPRQKSLLDKLWTCNLFKWLLLLELIEEFSDIVFKKKFKKIIIMRLLSFCFKKSEKNLLVKVIHQQQRSTSNATKPCEENCYHGPTLSIRVVHTTEQWSDLYTKRHSIEKKKKTPQATSLMNG